ncbi:hypothetical protein GGTG_00030 [Gaeumannomyces tritici R3-111a-1]|uniref:Uncharacterized protein n=1 Tax=Gaeumannomyces tritici (strain R3-111a-1) TaxID=644352 RepID=J3NFI4_GAET3|nr:hypothetical protein GGTG_00030 [Gaeumannomyces tritici R3-111a-1]EJT80024.1 hypothetical protein GGTG_00030 [Gaeumannomyces tritici R3-111a-1]
MSRCGRAPHRERWQGPLSGKGPRDPTNEVAAERFSASQDGCIIGRGPLVNSQLHVSTPTKSPGSVPSLNQAAGVSLPGRVESDWAVVGGWWWAGLARIVSGRPTVPAAWEPLHVLCQVEPATPQGVSRKAWETASPHRDRYGLQVPRWACRWVGGQLLLWRGGSSKMIRSIGLQSPASAPPATTTHHLIANRLAAPFENGHRYTVRRIGSSPDGEHWKQSKSAAQRSNGSEAQKRANRQRRAAQPPTQATHLRADTGLGAGWRQKGEAVVAISGLRSLRGVGTARRS